MKYHYTVNTVDGAGATHITKGVVDGPPPQALSEAMRESFEMLTSGRMDEYRSGTPRRSGCRGPYKIATVTLELVDY